MPETVEVTAKVTDVKHDGTNMIVLKEGKKVTVATSSVAFLLKQDAIEDPNVESEALEFDIGVGNGGDGTDASQVVAQADGFQAPVFDPEPPETANQRLPASTAFDHDGDGEPGGSLPDEPPALTGKNKAELTAIAEAESVEIKDGMTNREITEAIEAHRAAVAADADASEGSAPA